MTPDGFRVDQHLNMGVSKILHDTPRPTLQWISASGTTFHQKAADGSVLWACLYREARQPWCFARISYLDSIAKICRQFYGCKVSLQTGDLTQSCCVLMCTLGYESVGG